MTQIAQTELNITQLSRPLRFLVHQLFGPLPIDACMTIYIHHYRLRQMLHGSALLLLLLPYDGLAHLHHQPTTYLTRCSYQLLSWF